MKQHNSKQVMQTPDTSSSLFYQEDMLTESELDAVVGGIDRVIVEIGFAPLSPEPYAIAFKPLHDRVLIRR